MIVRNDRGKVTTALSEKISQPSSIEVMEALVVQRATKFTVELGIRHPIFEGDLKVVCKALLAAGFSFLTIGHIVKDSMSIASSLQTHSFSYTKRQGNSVAYALVRRIRFFYHLLVWMEFVSPNISRFVVFDLPII